MKDYLYFAMGETVDQEDKIMHVFDTGIISASNNLSKTSLYIDASDDNVIDAVKDIGYDTVFLIKIPSMYMTPKIVNGKLVQIPLPIWKKDISGYLITNELIYGAYIKKQSSFIYNSNYKELHNPIGLSFDKKQESIFDEYHINRWQRFYKLRDKLSYDEITKIDKEYKIWDSATKQYDEYINGKRTK